MTLQEIEKIVVAGESETVEFKKSTAQLPRVGETLCAFLNGRGGRVFIGITPEGRVIGQQIADSTLCEVAAMLARFEPPVSIDHERVQLSTGCEVLVLSTSVNPDACPYTFEGRAYQRVLSTTSPMPQPRYESMLMERAQGRNRRNTHAEGGQQMAFSDIITAPEICYERALGFITADDRIGWRKLVQAANEQGAAALKRWRTESPDIPQITERDQSARFAHVLSGVESYTPLIACLIAAAETKRIGYAEQFSWIDIILEPACYDKRGTMYHASFPQTVLFVAQALVGGMLMLNGAGETAHQLATTKIPDQFSQREAIPLFLKTKCNGWQDALESRCSVAWRFLDSLISSWTWLSKAYGNERECRSGISAYYQMLSFLNFLKLTKDGNLDSAAKPEFRGFALTAPISFCVWPADVVFSGYRTFLKQTGFLRTVLEANQLSPSDFQIAWAKWMVVVQNWLSAVYLDFDTETRLPQKNLPADLNRNPYAVG